MLLWPFSISNRERYKESWDVSPTAECIQPLNFEQNWLCNVPTCSRFLQKRAESGLAGRLPIWNGATTKPRRVSERSRADIIELGPAKKSVWIWTSSKWLLQKGGSLYYNHQRFSRPWRFVLSIVSVMYSYCFDRQHMWMERGAISWFSIPGFDFSS